MQRFYRVDRSAASAASGQSAPQYPVLGDRTYQQLAVEDGAHAAGGNLFWVYHDKICTTPTGRGVLPGITRAVVLEICQVLGLETNKRVIKPEALKKLFKRKML